MQSMVTTADMQLKERLFKYQNAAALPLSFCYGGRIIRGIPEEFDPKTTVNRIDANIMQYTISGCNEEGLEIRVEYLEYSDYPATEYVAFFTNRGTHDTKLITDIRIIDGVLEGTNALLVHGNGDTASTNGYGGYEWYRDPVGQLIEMTPWDGTSCKGAFPYMRLLFENFGVNIGIGWPARWKADFCLAEKGVQLAIGQRRCHMCIRPGETIRTPRVNFQAFTGDEIRGANMWRRWYFDHIMPRENGLPIQPKCCKLVWVPGKEHTTATEENQIQGINDFLEQGIHPDVWWIDAGWYPCEGFWPNTGTWHPDPARFPNGLGPIGRKCEEHDMKFLLWFEPERVMDGTEWAVKHPEWMSRLQLPDGTDNVDSLLNLGIPECCDMAIDAIDAVIKESHVKIYRQDFNCDPATAWDRFETEDRIGAMENLHVQGYLRLWDTLLLRNPGLIIDSCASGGRRNDLETMRRAVPFHYTDIGYGHHPMKQKQRHQMLSWIPYFRSQTMSWDDPADGGYDNPEHHIYLAPDKFAFYNAMAPAITDMTPHDASPEAMELSRTMLAIWRKAAHVMINADYYPLTECRKSAEDFYAAQFYNPDTGKGLLHVISNNRNQESVFRAGLQALEDEAVYIFASSEEGSTLKLTYSEGDGTLQFTGRQLKEGIEIPMEKRSAVIYFYERIR